jgi:hypothetical protein
MCITYYESEYCTYGDHLILGTARDRDSQRCEEALARNLALGQCSSGLARLNAYLTGSRPCCARCYSAWYHDTQQTNGVNGVNGDHGSAEGGRGN